MSNSVHIYGMSFSNFVRSVALVCEEKGVAYTTGIEIGGKKVEFHGAEHFEINPFGKIPVLIHGDRKLAETSVICCYLDSQFGPQTLQPSDGWLRAQHDQWCAMLSIYFDKAIIRDYLLELVFPKGENNQPRFDKIKQATPAVLNVLKIMEKQLEGKDYLLGDSFSIADALAAPMLHYLDTSPDDFRLLGHGSAVENYCRRLQECASGMKVLQAPKFA